MRKLLLILFLLSAPAWSIDITCENGTYHIILKGDKIKFVASDELITNREAHEKYGARLTVNAGFFDPKNGKTISYIVTDGQIAADPLFNENMMNNPVLRQNLDKILNRTEFRVVECGRKLRYEIVPHNAPGTVVMSVQGGPLIYPELQLEEEFFVVTENGKVVRESANVLHKTARTIIGLKGNQVHILIITMENPMDMYEVQALCRELGLERAMGFDGGGSTSMDYRDKYSVVSEGDGRKLKSFMLVY
jgi:exopolysaccharide biosynthesis protein